MAAAKKDTKKPHHNTLLRLRNETADALDRIQWETGMAKSEFIAEAVAEKLEKREYAILEGAQRGRGRGPCPKSPLHERIAAEIAKRHGEKKTDCADGEN